MRLLNTTTLNLEHFLGEVPPYAILSHTWEAEEVTLQDVAGYSLTSQKGWRKIVSFCNKLQTKADSLGVAAKYAWVDTCCIDKTSSAELSEAINAMFQWYRDAEHCFAYLSDVERASDGSVGDDFARSRWFTRGWTLQELLAPREVEFFDKNWDFIGTRTSLAERISAITSIDEHVLQSGDFSTASAARKMSWAANRRTTRVEDMAYCLLGLFNVNMPMLYGEGEKAFIRLQEEILRETDDHSIFAWDASEVPESITTIGVLAPNPSVFRNSYHIESHPSLGEPLTITNRGLQLEIPIVELAAAGGSIAGGSKILGILSCFGKGDIGSSIVLDLKRRDMFNKPRYSRTRADIGCIKDSGLFKTSKIYLVKKNTASSVEGFLRACSMEYKTTELEHIGAYPASCWPKTKPDALPSLSVRYPIAQPVWTIIAFRIRRTGECFGVTVALKPREYFGVVRCVALPQHTGNEGAWQEVLASFQHVEVQDDEGYLQLPKTLVTKNVTTDFVRNSLSTMKIKLEMH